MHESQISLRENLRALPRGAWILFFGTFLNKFGTFVLPFLAIYMTSLGYSVAQAGVAAGAYGLGSLVASFVGGYLADKLGRRKTIVLSMFSISQARRHGRSPALGIVGFVLTIAFQVYWYVKFVK